MARALSSTCLEDMPRGVFELPEKKTTALVVTQLRDRQTERADFIHFADRLTHQVLIYVFVSFCFLFSFFCFVFVGFVFVFLVFVFVGGLLYL